MIGVIAKAFHARANKPDMNTQDTINAIAKIRGYHQPSYETYGGLSDIRSDVETE